MSYYDDDYRNALAKYKYFDCKEWLLQYFELYKSTLIWPPGLPPIKRCHLVPGSLIAQFHTLYHDKLSDFEHEFNNEKQTLEIL
jgi:hypothetical protein